MGTVAVDLTGSKFSRLTVVKRVANHSSSGNAVFQCVCDCGNLVDVTGSHLRTGHTGSCGCLFVDFGGNHKHGATGTAEHDVWRSMLGRCNSPKREDYHGRGIKVCKRWHKFENFIADMGLRPSPDYSIEREGNNGNYEPGNCVWATSSQQGRNKRSNRYIELGGKRILLIEAAEKYGIPYKKLWRRVVAAGWSIEKALAA